MTDAEKNSASLRRPAPPSPDYSSCSASPGRNYLFIALAALAIYYILASSRAEAFGSDLDIGTLLTVGVAVLGLLGRWTIAPALFLIMATYLLFDPNFGASLFESDTPFRRSMSQYRRSGRTLELNDLLLAASILVYLIAQFRLLSFVHKSMPDDPPPRRKGQAEPALPRRPPQLFADREMGLLVLLALGSTIAGFFCWQAISTYESGGQLGGTWGIQRPFARFLLFVWGFATASTLTIVYFRYRGLCRMSRREARLLLQDTFWQETRREQERIYRWQRWYRKRSEKRKIVERS